MKLKIIHQFIKTYIFHLISLLSHLLMTQIKKKETPESKTSLQEIPVNMNKEFNCNSNNKYYHHLLYFLDTEI